MKVKAIFSERQPEYRYMPLGNGMADVFIYEFIEEVDSSEDESVQYVHNTNEFRINMNEITEEMIRENPMDYLNYIPENDTVNLEERINALEDAMMEVIGGIYNE